jgi:hypothetical protein
VPRASPRTVLQLGFMSLHLLQHCSFVRPRTCTEIVIQSLSLRVCTGCFSWLSSAAVHLPCLYSLGRCWDSRHNAICYDTDFSFYPVTARKLRLPSCVRTASFSLLSSSGVHFPLRSLAPPMLGSRTLCHLQYTDFSFDLERARKLRPNPCRRAFVLHASACCFLLPLMYPYAHSIRRCWISGRYTICDYTAFSFVPESAWKLRPNSWYRACFVQYPSA